MRGFLRGLPPRTGRIGCPPCPPCPLNCAEQPFRHGSASHGARGVTPAPGSEMDEQVEETRRGPRKPAGRALRAVKPREESRALSTGEAAAALGVTERTVRRAIARGELAAVRRGGAYRIPSQEVARFAAQLELRATPQLVARVTLLP